MSIPLAPLRLFHSSATDPDVWNSPTTITGLKVIVVALLMDLDEDLIASSALMDLTPEQLRDYTTVTIDKGAKIIKEEEYTIVSITLEFPNDVFKRQSYTIISATGGKTQSLVIARSFNKLDNLMTHWVSNEFGYVWKPVRFESSFLIRCLTSIATNLDDKSKLGDVELTFSTSHLTQGMLNTISVQVLNKDLLKFVQEDDTNDALFKTLLSHLETLTTLEFHKLKLYRFKCQYIVMGADGRLRFFKGMPMMESTEQIKFSAWDFIRDIMADNH